MAWRHWMLTPCLFLLPALPAASGEAGEIRRLDLESRISGVTVYSSGACVRRSARADLEAGRTRLAVVGLPPALIPDSLRVRLGGAAGARLLAVNYSLEPSIRPRRGDEERLVAELNRLDGELKAVNDQRAVLTAQAGLIRSLALPPQPAPEAGKPAAPAEAPPLAVAAWAGVLDFSQQGLTRTLDRLRTLNAEGSDIEKRIARSQEELDRLRARSVPAVAAALVDVECAKAGAVELELGYDVANAAWYPAYSFRVEPATGAAEMVRHAACAQNSGEDWNGVAMVFSTGEARRVAALPELRSWQIVEQVAGGALEPSAAGNDEPGEEVMLRPGELPAARTQMTDSPLAAFTDIARLRDAFGYQGLGSLGEAAGRLEASGVAGVIGLGGGGVSGCFGYRDGGGRKRAVLRFGGSAATESCAESSLGWLASHQQANGSWSSQACDGTARMDDADTALALLSFLGAGYTEKEGRHKERVAAAIGYLVSRQAADGSIGSDLWTRALAATALSEAYGMSRVPATGRSAQRAVSALAREVGGSPWPLQQGLSGKIWPDSPCNLALVALALKSAKVAGLVVDRGAILQVMALMEDLEASPPSPLNAAAAIVIRQMLGYGRMDEDNVRDARTMLANLPSYPGQLDYRYLYLGTMAMFQMGGEHWQKWNSVVRDMLVNRQERSGEGDGSWPPIDVCGSRGGLPGSGASRVYSTAMASMCLEVYYRYLPMYGDVARGGSGGPGSGSAHEPSQYIPPIISAGGRDFRARSLSEERLSSDGRFKLIAVERRELKATTRYVAAPVRYRGAFLEASAVNGSPEPLLAGEARLFLGTDYLGSVFMETVAPGAGLVIPLGLDPEIKLARHSRSERREAGFRKRLRQTTYEVTLEAANHKNRPIELVLADRIPIPEDARIRVTDVSFKGGQPEYDPEGDSGQVKFTVRLKPGEAGKVGMTYTVEHPSDIEAVLGRTGQ